MPFEFAFLDWLQQFHNPVLDALAVFLNYAGEHGEIWIAFTLLLLLFRRTRRAGCILALALVCDLVLCNFILKPLVHRVRPCDLLPEVTLLIPHPSDYSFPSGHTAAAMAAAVALIPAGKRVFYPMLVLAYVTNADDSCGNRPHFSFSLAAPKILRLGKIKLTLASAPDFSYLYPTK